MRLFKIFLLLLLIVILDSLLIACTDESVVASKPISKVLPDANSQGAKILKEKCSQCHGAPNPNVHVAEEWPNVVRRMQTHRIRKAYGAIPEAEEQVLISYLQKYSVQ